MTKKEKENYKKSTLKDKNPHEMNSKNYESIIISQMKAPLDKYIVESIGAQLGEKRIIQEFQVKRKLLVKALKNKKKTQQLNEIRMDKIQNKEGFQSIILTEQNKKMSTLHGIKTEPNVVQSQQIHLEGHFPSVDPGQKDSYINQGTQTSSFLSKNKYLSKVLTVVKEQKTDIQSQQKERFQTTLLQKYQSKQVENNSELRKKIRGKGQLQIQRIKQSIVSMFIKNQPDAVQNTDSNTLTVLQADSNHSGSPQQNYANIFLQITQLNQNIQQYYHNKPLKQVIMDQFYRKYNKRLLVSKDQYRRKTRLQRRIERNNRRQRQKKIFKRSKRLSKENILNVQRSLKNKFSLALNNSTQLKYLQKSEYKSSILKKPNYSNFKPVKKDVSSILTVIKQAIQIMDNTDKYQYQELIAGNQIDYDHQKAWGSQFQLLVSIIYRNFPSIKKNVRQKIISKTPSHNKIVEGKRFSKIRNTNNDVKGDTINQINELQGQKGKKKRIRLSKTKLGQNKTKNIQEKALTVLENKQSKKFFKFSNRSQTSSPEGSVLINQNGSIQEQNKIKIKSPRKYKRTQKRLYLPERLKQIDIDVNEYDVLGASFQRIPQEQSNLNQSPIYQFKKGAQQISGYQDLLQMAGGDIQIEISQDSSKNDQSLSHDTKGELQTSQIAYSNTINFANNSFSSVGLKNQNIHTSSSRQLLDQGQILQKKAQWNLFKGQKGSEYFYMSQQFQ